MKTKLSIILTAFVVVPSLCGLVLAGAIGDNGDLYVGEYDLGKIVQYDVNGNFVGDVVTGLVNPHGLDWNSTGQTMYVVEHNVGVNRYTATGTLLGSTALAGAGGVAVDGSDNVWVSAGPNVQQWNSDFTTSSNSADYSTKNRKRSAY